MANKTQVHQAQIDQLVDVIRTEDISGRGGVVDNEEFLLWASQRHLQVSSDPPSLDDIQDCITDGTDDQGLDLFHIDDDSEVVHLVQSKYRRKQSTVKRDVFDSLLQLPFRLMDGGSLRSIRNERVKEFAKDFRRCVDKGYAVRLAYLTTERPTKQIQDAVARWNSVNLALGQHSSVPHLVQIVDSEAFLKPTLNYNKPTDTYLTLSDFFVKSQPDGSLKTLQGTLAAEELMRVFEQHNFAIFTLNPRGPLGNVKVNKDILNTLGDDTERVRFHILNNGLTAVCESFKEDENSKEVEIRDLQIVNGCQTTWSIYDHDRVPENSLNGVFVNIKLTEAPPSDKLASDISLASNSQSKMVDWDFLFNEPDQLNLQQQFERLDDRVFYELKRGEHRYIEGSRLRKTTVKDVAQATYAFVGYPSEAKDRLRYIPRSVRNDDSEYKKVFFDGVTARHLMLPLLVHDRVKLDWKDNPPTKHIESGDISRRLHVVWLIGEIVKRASGVADYSQIDIHLINRITATIDAWFERANRIANYAVNDTLRFYEDRDGQLRVSLRQMFRATRIYVDYLEYLNRGLEERIDGVQREMLGSG